jgi:hypothetical protein
MTRINYDNATFNDGGTGLPRELVFKTLFVSDEPGFNASFREELNALSSEINLPDSLNVSEVRVTEIDSSLVDFVVRCPELTVGTQTSRGEHERLVLNDESYKHYRVGIEAG